MKENQDFTESVYTVNLLGVGGHGSRPDLSNSPILCYGAFISALMRVPFDVADLRVLSAVSGSSANIIPESATVTLSVLADDKGKVLFEKGLDQTLSSVCKIYRCKYKILK